MNNKDNVVSRSYPPLLRLTRRTSPGPRRGDGICLPEYLRWCGLLCLLPRKSVQQEVREVGILGICIVPTLLFQSVVSQYMRVFLPKVCTGSVTVLRSNDSISALSSKAISVPNISRGLGGLFPGQRRIRRSLSCYHSKLTRHASGAPHENL